MSSHNYLIVSIHSSQLRAEPSSPLTQSKCEDLLVTCFLTPNIESKCHFRRQPLHPHLITIKLLNTDLKKKRPLTLTTGEAPAQTVFASSVCSLSFARWCMKNSSAAHTMRSDLMSPITALAASTERRQISLGSKHWPGQRRSEYRRRKWRRSTHERSRRVYRARLETHRLFK